VIGQRRCRAQRRLAQRTLAVLLSAGALAACHSHSDRPTVSAPRVGSALAPEQLLARSLDDAPHSIDPQLANDVPGQRLADDLFEGLTRVDIAGNAAPGVASSWQQSRDGLTWVFHLRPEARWSNGAAISAADFVYAWRREVDPHTGAPYAEGLAPIENALAIAGGHKPLEALGARALDAHTLEVRLTGPTPYLLDLLAQQYLYPIYEPAVRRFGDDWVRPEHLVSNGAFVLRENVLNSRLTLAKNPYYWDAPQVRLQRVVYYVAPDRAVQATRFLAGEVQWTDSLAADQRLWLKSLLGEQVVGSPYFGTFTLGFGAQLPPFKGNPALRAALVLAIDREPLVRFMKEGMYQPAYTLMPPLPGYALPLPAWVQLSDADRHALARRLYHQAGYSDAHPLRVALAANIQGPDERHFFEAVIALWREVLGARVSLDEREFKVLIQDRLLHKLPLFFDAWIGDYPDPYTFMQTFYTGNGNNNCDYSDPRFDQLVDQAGQLSDNAQRYRLFEHAEALLNEQFAYVPLYYYATRHLVKPYLKGWQSNVMDRNLSSYMYLLEHQGS
jgi:oligopeptide transport system substrate-binding protein